MRAEWRELDRRIAGLRRRVRAQARTDEAARLLATIPGIGPLNATALVAAIGKAETFARGRDLAAWLGLVPRQMTTGGKPKLLGISKRGNEYLRKMLIHGARAALPTLSKSETPLGEWLRGLTGAGAREHRGGGAGRQAGADRLGGAAQRAGVRDAGRRRRRSQRDRPTALTRRGRLTMSAGGGSEMA